MLLKISVLKTLKLEYFLLNTFIHALGHTVTNMTSQKERETNGIGVGKWCFVETADQQ